MATSPDRRDRFFGGYPQPSGYTQADQAKGLFIPRLAKLSNPEFVSKVKECENNPLWIKHIIDHINDFDFPSASVQILGERYLPYLLQHFMDLPTHSCELWAPYLSVLHYLVLSNSSVVKRVLQSPEVIKKFIKMLPVLADLNDPDPTKEVNPVGALTPGSNHGLRGIGTEHACMELSLCVLYTCCMGSRPNTEYWQDATKELNLKYVVKKCGPFNDEQCAVFCTFARALKSIHKVNVKLPNNMQRVLHKTPFDYAFSAPAQRLNSLLYAFATKYAVFCSSPTCGKTSPTDQTFGKCSQCHLCRYCSKECQVRHWGAEEHNLWCEKKTE